MEEIKRHFINCKSQEELFQVIISLGRKLPPFNPDLKIERNRVLGCQSLMYLSSSVEDHQIYFSAFSEALISAGLAALLLEFYNGKSPDEVLKTPPSFLEELNIPSSLTPGRANGLSALYLQMKKQALHFLLN